eukprot:3954447-Amphidinium_carterae.1
MQHRFPRDEREYRLLERELLREHVMEDTLRLLRSSSSPAGPSASPSSGMSGQRWEGQRYYADTEQDDNEPVYYEGADVDEE